MLVGSPGLLGGGAPNGVHVVVSHVRPRCSLVLRTAGEGKLLVGNGDVRYGTKGAAEGYNWLPCRHLRYTDDPFWGSSTIPEPVAWTVERCPRPEGRGLVEDSDKPGKGAAEHDI